MNDFFLMACAHFFSNDFFSEIESCTYAEVISEDVHDALQNDTLELGNGIILQVAEDYQDIPVENLLGNIEVLETDLRKTYQEGREDAQPEIIAVSLDNGDSALFVNKDAVYQLDASESGQSPLSLGEYLAKSLGTELRTVNMPVPNDDEWSWNDVYELVPSF
jgi:hypothetical protein